MFKKINEIFFSAILVIMLIKKSYTFRNLSDFLV